MDERPSPLQGTFDVPRGLDFIGRTDAHASCALF